MKASHSSRRGFVLSIVARNIIAYMLEAGQSDYSLGLSSWAKINVTHIAAKDVATCRIVIYFKNVAICNGVHKNRDDTMISGGHTACVGCAAHNGPQFKRPLQGPQPFSIL